MVEGKSQVPVVLSDLCVCHDKHRPIYPHTTTQEQINKRYFMGIFERINSGFKQSPRHIVMV